MVGFDDVGGLQNKSSKGMRYVVLYKYAMLVWLSWWNVSQRDDGFPEGGARWKTIIPRGDIPSRYPHWHGIFVLLYRTNIQTNIPNKPQFGKISMKTTMTAGRSSENGGCFAGGHDGMANLCKPITAYDFHVGLLHCSSTASWTRSACLWVCSTLTVGANQSQSWPPQMTIILQRNRSYSYVVKRDIESMHWLYVWENYLDVFAPD